MENNKKFLYYKNIYQDIENFRVKAQKHIKYLKIILFVFMLYLLDIKFFDNIQFSCVSFIILFQLAFTQNMLNNLTYQINKNKD